MSVTEGWELKEHKIWLEHKQHTNELIDQMKGNGSTPDGIIAALAGRLETVLVERDGAREKCRKAMQELVKTAGAAAHLKQKLDMATEAVIILDQKLDLVKELVG